MKWGSFGCNSIDCSGFISICPHWRGQNQDLTFIHWWQKGQCWLKGRWRWKGTSLSEKHKRIKVQALLLRSLLLVLKWPTEIGGSLKSASGGVVDQQHSHFQCSCLRKDLLSSLGKQLNWAIMLPPRCWNSLLSLCISYLCWGSSGISKLKWVNVCSRDALWCPSPLSNTVIHRSEEI